MNDFKHQGAKMQPPGNANPPGNSNPPRPTGLTTEIQARIGHQLRSMYDEVVRQGVPDRFADLIRKLDEPAAATTIPKAEGSE
jgi:hypothetical protein